MGSVVNPAKTLRAGLISKADAGKDKNKGLVWVLFLVEIVATIVAFVISKERFTYLCDVLGCTPLGGFMNAAISEGQALIRGAAIKDELKNLLPNYGQWLFSGFQYMFLVVIMRMVKASGGNKFLQLVHGIADTLFSGVALLTLSRFCIIEKNGIIMTVINGFKKNNTLHWKNLWLWGFAVMIILLALLIVLACCSLIENIFVLFKSALILIVICSGLALIRTLLGSYVSGNEDAWIGAKKIVDWTQPLYNGGGTIAWLIVIILLLAYVFTAMTTTNK